MKKNPHSSKDQKASKKGSLSNLLSEKEQEEFNKNILANKKVSELIFAAEVCLLAKNSKVEHVNNKLVTKIKKMNLLALKSAYFQRNLTAIFKQILISLKSQQLFFINQLTDKFFSSYEKSKNFVDPFDQLQKLLQESSKILQLPDNACNVINLNQKERKKISSAKNLMKGRSSASKQIILITLFLLLIFVLMLAVIYFFFREDLQDLSVIGLITLISGPILFILLSHYSTDIICTSGFNDDKELVVEGTFPKLKLKNIRVVNFSSGKIEDSRCEPTFKIKTAEQTEQSQQAIITSQDEKPSAPPKSKRWHYSKPETSLPHSEKLKVITKIQWSEENLLLGRKGRIINQDRLFEMRSRGGNRGNSKGSRTKTINYVGIFNERAVKRQGLKPEDREWKDYSSTIDKGLITTERSGLKPLNPVSTHVKIENKNYGFHTYKYEVRIVGQLYRLLGEICAEQEDENGDLWKLVDFNWHLQKGLH